MPACVSTGCTFARLFRSRPFLRRLQINTRAARLGKPYGNGLLRRARTVLAFTDMIHLFAYELTGLSARRLPLTFISANPLDGLLFWHVISPVKRHGRR
jgi:hypothetical protein